MARLNLQFLGPIQLQSDGIHLEGFDSDKVRALLAYIAVEAERPQPRDKLAGLLWPDYPDQSARTSLRRALSNLRTVTADRKADPPYFLATRQSIQFNQASDFELDVFQFETGLNKASDNAALEVALSFYHGPFLEGFSLPDSAAFEEWILLTRESLQRKYLDGLRRLSSFHNTAGDIEAALLPLYRIVDVEPYDESARRQLMRLLAGSGRQAEALGQYESLQKLLAEQLYTDPADQTRHLFEKIRSGVFDGTSSNQYEDRIRAYELRVKIGSGKFGEVYLAHQPGIGRDVAVKVITPEYADQPDFIRQFEEEAQLVARLEHPHIVPLYDYWREPGGAYLVMRLLRGGSLAGSLAGGPWKPEAAAGLVDQVAAALDAAHRRGIVHRDIKPANILLDEEGNAYLSDFGISTLVGPASQVDESDLASTSGSLGYLSPESVVGSGARPSSDIYSLGVVLFELLTGRHPFPGLTGEALIEKHRLSPLPPAAQIRSGIPAGVDQVIQRATDKDPDRRFASALDLAAAFRQASTGQVSQTPGILFPVENPYKGLRTFQQADAADFFGRENLTAHILDRLKAGERLIALVGPSGSGKSSAVKAGLLPALRGGRLKGSRGWFITEFSPGENPFESLETALLRVAVNPPERLEGQLRDDARGLLRAADRCLPDDTGQLVVLIDQFEELFTMTRQEEERRAFLERIQAAVEDPRSRLRIVITLRADFYDRPLAYPEFGQLLKEHTEVILPLTSEELGRAIEKPAERMGITLEKGLATLMVADVLKQPGSLPLLQFALTELFEHRSGAMMTITSYRQGGGVTGALGRRAEEVFAGLQPADQALARQVFLRLIAPGENAQNTRRRVLRRELEGLAPLTLPAENADPESVMKDKQGDSERILAMYDSARLLSFNRDPATRESTIEVAHEALLSEWDRLAGWIEEHRSSLVIQRRLQSAAEEWVRADKDDSALLRGVRLVQFEAWSVETPILLSPLENEFIRASLSARSRRKMEEESRQARERSLERRSRLVLRALAGVFGLAAVVALVLTWFAFQQRDLAESLALASNSRLALNAGETDLALALAFQAAQIDDTPAEVQLALAQAAYAPGTRFFLEGHAAAPVYSLSLSPDQTQALSGAIDRTVILWDISNGKALQRYGGFDGSVGQVSFLPDGKRALVGVLDSSLRIIDLETGDELQRLMLRPPFLSAAFSGDGEQALWINEAGRLRLFDLESQEAHPEFGPTTTDHLSGSPSAIAFLPTGSRAVVGRVDGTLAIWDIQMGERSLEIGSHPAPIKDLSVSPDGFKLLSADANGGIALWNLDTGVLERKYTPAANPDKSYRVAFLPDGDTALLGTSAGGLILWSLDTGEVIARFGDSGGTGGHAAWVTAIAPAPDGQFSATAGADGAVILWDLTTREQQARFDLSETTGTTSSALSLDIDTSGDRLLAGYENGSLAVWDLASGDLLNLLETNPWNVESAAFQDGGSAVVFSTLDGGLNIWDISETDFDRLFDGVAAGWPVTALSDDGTRLLFTFLDPGSPGNPDDLVLWNLESGQADSQLPGSEHQADISALAISPDGTKALSGDAAGGFVRWDLSAGIPIGTVEYQGVYFNDLVFSPDGSRALTASESGGISLWDMQTGELLMNFPTALDPQTVDFSLDGATAYAGLFNGEIQLWDVDSGNELTVLAGHSNRIWDFEIGGDGRTAISSSGETTVRVWDLGNGAASGELAWPGFQFGVEIFGDGTSALTGGGSDLLVWDLKAREMLQQLPGHDLPIFDVEVSPDDRYAISSAGSPFEPDPSSLVLWDLQAGKEIRRLDSEEQIFQVAFDPESRYAAISARRTEETPPLFLWDLQSGQVLDRFRIDLTDFSADDVAFSPDGRRLLAGYLDPFRGGYAGVWDTDSGALLQTLEGHESPVINLAYLPDGQDGVTVSWDRSMILWDLVTGEIIRQMTGRNTEVFSVAVSPDGGFALTGFGDGRMALWDLSSGETIRTYDAHAGLVTQIVFGPEGDYALTSGTDGRVRIWRIDRTTQDLMSFITENRFLLDVDCGTRALYRIEPLCE